MSNTPFIVLGYGIDLYDFDLIEYDYTEFTERLYDIGEETNVFLDFFLLEGGAYLYFQYEAPWSYSDSAILMTRDKIDDMLYNIVTPYFAREYSYDEFKKHCRLIEDISS